MYIVYFIVSTLTFVRVLIPAVSKKTINPKLHIFNNCFDDSLVHTSGFYIDLHACTYMDCEVYALFTPVCSFTIYHRACQYNGSLYLSCSYVFQ